MDSPINDRLLSLKLTEQQIRNNHNVKSAKALGLVIERDRRTRDNFCSCFSGRGYCDTDIKESITSFTDGVETFPQFRKTSADIP